MAQMQDGGRPADRLEATDRTSQFTRDGPLGSSALASTRWSRGNLRKHPRGRISESVAEGLEQSFAGVGVVEDAQLHHHLVAEVVELPAGRDRNEQDRG